LAALMAVPLPYRVACDCELQPVLRRFVAAPYAGVLERTLAKNGDIVTKDQLLARMDGRNLRIELSGLQAELAGAKKRRDLALAQGDIAKSQIARSEMDRFQSKIQLLEERTRNLEVCSPIDGIVVSGDLQKVEGAPLEMGQTLFEVAPLDQMISEIAIPEAEIQYVSSGQEVAIKLSAFPFKTWTGTIKRIHPRTEIVNDESVFVAEVALENEGIELKPGMQGSAKIQSGWAPLGWNLFHRPWETVRYWTIW
jgi:multidrug resistance efflux pump